MNDAFAEQFSALTGFLPFPWQSRLYERMVKGDWPDSCDIPTGLGKTNVIVCWLIALANAKPNTVPRRLAYVVNRRTVVDQTTAEAEKLKAATENGKLPGISQLAISTLRGQFADNREWSADPSRPAVIIGTVDMIGSRLLFSGYGVGFKAKPLHAGFLGQDTLLVHDEAHLEPAFQKLIETIECEQKCRERTGDLPWPKLRVMQLTATTRNGPDKQNDRNQGSKKPFELTGEEKEPPEKHPDMPTEPIHHVWRRLKAKKVLTLHQAGDGKDAVAQEIAKLATTYKDSKAAVVVFARTLDDLGTIEEALGKTKRDIVLLTGTMRGKERDELVEKPEFKRFLKCATPSETVYLVCTSAGEVGVDISADHMVCDLSTFESMAQRFGRVNRYGERDDTRVDVVHPSSFGKIDKKTGELQADEIDKRREKTLKVLQELRRLDGNHFDASPLALSKLDPVARSAAFAPEPVILPATDILFDAWSLTSIRQSMPGRPPVEPYLHGIAEWQPPETHVAWRQEVEIITGELLDEYPPTDLLEDYPLKPHELLRDATERRNTGVLAQLTCIAKRCPDANVWIVDAQGGVSPAKLKDVVDGDSRRLHGATVLLPPSVGGLSAGGMLDGDAAFDEQIKYDVADIDQPPNQRLRIWSDDPDYVARTKGMRLVRSIEFARGDDDEDEDGEPRTWDWFELVPEGGGRTATRAVLWQTHVDDVVQHTEQIVSRLDLPAELREAVMAAARLHDHGKRRERFQLSLGNRQYPDVLLAKSDRRAAAMFREPFRHEFGSVLDARADDEFKKLSPEMQVLALHLVAAHHGRARPHFDLEEAFDPTPPPGLSPDDVAVEVPRRFARLQRKYGRWGLAYLESLLRAADWAASVAPSKVLDANGNEVAP